MKLTNKLLLNKNTAKFGLSAMYLYKTLLQAKLTGLTFTINKLKPYALKDNQNKQMEKESKKEEKDMKGFLKFFAVAALATLAAAVYYMYKKDKHLKNLEDMMYGEHFEDDYFDDAASDYADYQGETPQEDETI